jgi:ParB-like chromosome segregation protein Spo0J
MATNKGFDAKRSDTFVYDPDDLIIVGLDTDDGAEHALWDQRSALPVDEGMVLSILAEGVIVPVIIAKYVGKDEASLGKAAVVDGRQRVRAAREAKARQVKAGATVTVRVEAKARRADDKRLALAGIITNEIRQDDGMLVKAEKASRLRAQGATIAEIAMAFGVSTKAIEQWFGLDEASAPVKKAVAAGIISPTAAAKIAKLDGRDAQEEALAEVVASGKTSTKDVKKAVAARKGKAKAREEGTDGVGIGRKIQKRLLEYAIGTPDEEKDPYWEGVRDALRVILGDKARTVAGKLKTGLRKCGVEEV